MLGIVANLDIHKKFLLALWDLNLMLRQEKVLDHKD
jgi:hypothetical protein